jgi:hypothetical protein
METELKNLAMSMRISQMMTQQVMQNLQHVAQDLGKAFGLINEMQYKVLAMQKVGTFDVSEMDKLANEMRLNDFIEASDKEDKEQGFTIGTVVDENSTVILTSTTNGQADLGIFRSRIKLSECGVPDLVKALTGQPVGTKATVKLNGVDHEVELLGIRQPAPAPAAPEAATLHAVSDPADQASNPEVPVAK